MGRERVAVVGNVAVLETVSSTVSIEGDIVLKTRKPRFWRLARRELAALKRLQGLEGFPVLLDHSPDGLQITLKRLPGTVLHDCDEIPSGAIEHLRALVETMLDRGVARHSLPA